MKTQQKGHNFRKNTPFLSPPHPPNRSGLCSVRLFYPTVLSIRRVREGSISCPYSSSIFYSSKSYTLKKTDKNNGFCSKSNIIKKPYEHNGFCKAKILSESLWVRKKSRNSPKSGESKYDEKLVHIFSEPVVVFTDMSLQNVMNAVPVDRGLECLFDFWFNFRQTELLVEFGAFLWQKSVITLTQVSKYVSKSVSK